MDSREQIMRYARENLDAEFKRNEAILARIDEISAVVDIAIAALQDHSPALSAVLMDKAKSAFNR